MKAECGQRYAFQKQIVHQHCPRAMICNSVSTRILSVVFQRSQPGVHRSSVPQQAQVHCSGREDRGTDATTPTPLRMASRVALLLLPTLAAALATTEGTTLIGKKGHATRHSTTTHAAALVLLAGGRGHYSGPSPPHPLPHSLPMFATLTTHAVAPRLALLKIIQNAVLKRWRL